MKTIANHITIRQAAARLGISRQRMSKICDTYRLQLIRVGNLYLIPDAELSKIPAKRPSGRKLSKK